MQRVRSRLRRCVVGFFGFRRFPQSGSYHSIPGLHVPNRSHVVVRLPKRAKDGQSVFYLVLPFHIHCITGVRVSSFRILAELEARQNPCDTFNSRSEEHTSELQSLMRISYAVFCLKKKTMHIYTTTRLDTHTISIKTNVNTYTK